MKKSLYTNRNNKLNNNDTSEVTKEENFQILNSYKRCKLFY